MTHQQLFDQKFGAAFSALPKGAGVYEYLDATGATLYVGKAKDLRQRLRQYRGATRRKIHRKMRSVVHAAASLRVTPCKDELEALLLENERIQSFKPPFNVAGAFTFLYPCVGYRWHGRDLDLCCTTSPEELSDFEFTGAFRSRALTREAFAALVELLGFVGHAEPRRKLTDLPTVPYTRVVRFRQLSARWLTELTQFLSGTAKTLLSSLVLALVENRAARRNGDDVQQNLEVLRAFWEQECVPLREALDAVGAVGVTFVAQGERDRTFLKATHADRS